MVQNKFDDFTNEKQNIRIPGTSLDLRAVWYIHAVSEPNAYAKRYGTFLKNAVWFSCYNICKMQYKASLFTAEALMG